MPLEARPETPREARIARRREMWRRKAAVVVPLLQGLSASQIGTRSGTSYVSSGRMGTVAATKAS